MQCAAPFGNSMFLYSSVPQEQRKTFCCLCVYVLLYINIPWSSVQLTAAACNRNRREQLYTQATTTTAPCLCFLLSFNISETRRWCTHGQMVCNRRRLYGNRTDRPYIALLLVGCACRRRPTVVFYIYKREDQLLRYAWIWIWQRLLAARRLFHVPTSCFCFSSSLILPLSLLSLLQQAVVCGCFCLFLGSRTVVNWMWQNRAH